MEAKCKGQPLSIFFDFDSEEQPYTEALATARSFCDSCPMRAPCLMAAMEAEGNDGAEYRAGIFGGMTPQQRHSFHKRGTPYGCGKCGAAFDPVLLRQGILRCECLTETMRPIPDRGDLWTERHTKLARMVITWLIRNVPVKGEAPDAMSLSKQLKVGVKDLRRVYQALREDRILVRENDTLVYNTDADSWHWLPAHLRVDVVPAVV